MTKDPASCNTSEPVTKVASVMKQQDVGSVPVVDSGRLVAKPISTAVKKLKLIDPTGELVRTAKGIGIELGG